MNYRVGVFGFLASEEVKKDGNLNTGNLDQRFALKWIQKYISKVSFSIYSHLFFANLNSLAVIQQE